MRHHWFSRLPRPLPPDTMTSELDSATRPAPLTVLLKTANRFRPTDASIIEIAALSFPVITESKLVVRTVPTLTGSLDCTVAIRCLP